MWRSVTATVGREDEFSSAISEVIAHRLLEGPAGRLANDDFEELAKAVIPTILAQGWQKGGHPIDPPDIDHAVHVPLGEWRRFGFLHEEHPRWVDGRSVGSYVTSLSEAGRAAAMAHLYARATEPRQNPFD